MEWNILFCALSFVFGPVSSSSEEIVEVSSDGGLLHYTPVSSSTHWLFPLSFQKTNLLVGPPAVLFERSKDGSLSITTWDPSLASIQALDIGALVRCELGCDARLQEVAFDGQCEVTRPPTCIRFIPRFKRLLICLKTGEFIIDRSDPPFANIYDAVVARRVHGETPYNITVTC